MGRLRQIAAHAAENAPEKDGNGYSPRVDFRRRM